MGKKHNGRIITLVSLLLVVVFLFSIRLMQLQIVEGASYREQASKKSVGQITMQAARGDIVDRYGKPLATNRSGYNVVFDKIFMNTDETNTIILRLSDLMRQQNEKWIDNLPLTTTQPIVFIDEMEKELVALKNSLRLQGYATAENVMQALIKKYKIDDSLPPEQIRTIAGVRYEMERRGFSNDTQYTFAEDISMSTLTSIKENGDVLPGVDIVETPIRQYVAGDIASNIIGYINPITADQLKAMEDQGYQMDAIIGQAGLESAFEAQLRGTTGTRRVEKSSSGDIISNTIIKEPVPGSTVVTTLDKNFQEFVQKALARNIDYIRTHRDEGGGTKGGSAVVIDVRTGEILAMATYPTYDINDLKQNYKEVEGRQYSPLINRPVSGLYRPGSTFKPFVALAALSNGTVTANDTVYCDGKYHYYAPWEPECMGFHRDTNVTKALTVSCNIYFYDVGRRLGIDTLFSTAQRFGFGVPTGIEIKEAVGVVANPKYRESKGGTWQAGDVIQTAIGQSDTMITPLQMAVATAAIANGGNRMEASIVKEIKSYDFANTLYSKTPKVLDTFENNNNALEIVRAAMLNASKDRSGTGYSVFGNYAIDVAHKTGSPQTSNTTSDAAFISFAPYENPEIAVIAYIENASHGYYNAPLVKEIYDYYFFSNDQKPTPTAEGELIP